MNCLTRPKICNSELDLNKKGNIVELFAINTNKLSLGPCTLRSTQLQPTKDQSIENQETIWGGSKRRSEGGYKSIIR